MKKIFNFFNIHAFFIFMISFIFYQSSQPARVVSYDGETNFLLHKFAHVVVYVLLFISSVRSFKDSRHALIFTILYAISDEFHQSFVQTRTSSFRDVVIDSISAGVFYLIINYYKNYLPKIIRKFLRV